MITTSEKKAIEKRLDELEKEVKKLKEMVEKITENKEQENGRSTKAKT